MCFEVSFFSWPTRFNLFSLSVIPKFNPGLALVSWLILDIIWGFYIVRDQILSSLCVLAFLVAEKYCNKRLGFLINISVNSLSWHQCVLWNISIKVNYQYLLKFINHIFDVGRKILALFQKANNLKIFWQPLLLSRYVLCTFIFDNSENIEKYSHSFKEKT